jgi:hypothetical protein
MRLCGDSRSRMLSATIALTAFSWIVIHGLGFPSITAPRRSCSAA